jgi:erythromycin esterase
MKAKLRNNFLVFAAVIGLIGCGRDRAQVASSDDDHIFKLEPGRPIERELKPEEIHSYEIMLIAGQFVRVIVEQHGIDIAVAAFEPAGKKIADNDGSIGLLGSVSVEIEAGSSGAYRLSIRPVDQEAKPGRYVANIDVLLSPEENKARLAENRVEYEATKGWVRSHAIPLKTVEAGSGFEDMRPLKKIIGGARVVALGEATHGTREFFRLKHRMLEFLVTEMGFTVFGIEASMPEGFDVNEYVLTGDGDPEKALAGLNLWVWDTEEVLEMIRWMRKYNEDVNHLKKVKFYGFDMQYPTRAAKRAAEYLDDVDPGQASMLKSELEDLSNPVFLSRGDFWTQSSQRKGEILALVKILGDRFDEHRAEYIQRSGTAEWEVARQHVKILEQWILMVVGTEGNVRDDAMAENIRWILEREGPDARMVVWAHNDHIALSEAGWGMLGMGWNLRKTFGDDYRTFGFTFNRGSFQAAQLNPFRGAQLRRYTLDPAPEGSFEAAMGAAGLPIAAIDLRDIPDDGPVHKWFASPHATYDIGGGYNEEDDMSFSGLSDPQVLPTRYDAVLFVEKTEAARPNPSGRLKPRQILDLPRNLDFEEGPAGSPPPGWEIPTRANSLFFQAVTNAEHPWNGRLCAVINRLPGKGYGETFGSIGQLIDAAHYRGKKITLRAAVRVDAGGGNDKAYLWLSEQRPGYRHNLGECIITSSEWSEYEITGEVSADAVVIAYVLAYPGIGEAYIDSVSLEARLR